MLCGVGFFWDDIFYKQIPGWESYYISSAGDIASKRRKKVKFRKLDLADNGYYRITFCVDGRITKHPVHRLVALAWIGPKPFERAEINHKNGIKTDNDYKTWNGVPIWKIKFIGIRF